MVQDEIYVEFESTDPEVKAIMNQLENTDFDRYLEIANAGIRLGLVTWKYADRKKMP